MATVFKSLTTLTRCMAAVMGESAATNNLAELEDALTSIRESRYDSSPPSSLFAK
jgi:hypothetical protein